MANVDHPYGFPPTDSIGGGAFYTQNYDKLVGYATALGIFDLVDVVSTGDDVNQGAAGGPFIGVGLMYSAASTAATIPVIVLTPQTLCHAQEDGVGGAIAAADETLNADVIVAAANATTGESQMEIDSNTAATTSTLDLRLQRLHPAVGNAQGANARYLLFVNDLRIGDLKAAV